MEKEHLSEKNERPVVEVTEQEEKDIESHVPQRAPVIFEIVRRAGEEELNRPVTSLWWSGLAAGLSMGFSVLTQAFLHDLLHGVPGAEFLEKFGYCVGFLIVICARQQLFTENTLTSVVPLIAHFHKDNLAKFGKVWGTVLLSNVVGTILFAFLLARGHFVSHETLSAVHDISLKPFTHPPGEVLSRGIAAGFIIASLVWILANLEASKVGMIIILTYLVAIGEFSHVIAGSVEAAFAYFDGSIPLAQAFAGFFLPALVGNVIGGTLLFAMLAYGQTHQEMIQEESASQT